MNIDELRAKMNDFLDQLEKELLEEICSIKSFQDATPEEVKEYLNLHYNNKIDLSDYWKVGDKRVEDGRATYVILDYTESNLVIMRTDLTSFGSCMSSLKHSEYIGSDVELRLSKLRSYILGDTFSDLVKYRSIQSPSDYRCRYVWLPSASEVFGEEASEEVKKDGEQFSYFKKESNRRLGECWWTRSGFLDKDSDARFVYCGMSGSPYHCSSDCSCGLAPCFYI